MRRNGWSRSSECAVKAVSRRRRGPQARLYRACHPAIFGHRGRRLTTTTLPPSPFLRRFTPPVTPELTTTHYFVSIVGSRTYAYSRVDEIKSIPFVPVSHPFVERLIGTIRREFLDHVLIWNAIDLGRKLEEFRNYYNESRGHQSLSGRTPGERSGHPPPAHAVLDHYAWGHHCRGLFQMPTAA
jgi:Integrase core domain